MNYKLFIDDERYPSDESFMIARSSDDAIRIIEEKGLPSYISFDHDLGDDDTSIAFINALIEKIIDQNMKLDDNFDYYVHSQNPVGRDNIKSKMDGFLKFYKDNLRSPSP